MNACDTGDNHQDAKGDLPIACWSRNDQAQMLRVILSEGGFLLLPYQHLHFVSFAPGQDVELIQASFASHTVEVTGHHLRELALAFQTASVDWIQAVPKHYSEPMVTGIIQIESIQVTGDELDIKT